VFREVWVGVVEGLGLRGEGKVGGWFFLGGDGSLTVIRTIAITIQESLQ
jgi:hypothetical protein